MLDDLAQLLPELIKFVHRVKKVNRDHIHKYAKRNKSIWRDKSDLCTCGSGKMLQACK